MIQLCGVGVGGPFCIGFIITPLYLRCDIVTGDIEYIHWWFIYISVYIVTYNAEVVCIV